ncbi:uncharacterized protein LOC126837966 [Adelges cooleyi]|uniref:uncharacterized protein LOC126837966 n=1 Tax=Adelges cooleyi TaxID=133065 RepID=UPI0021807E43|nr:uncharacterized protein LOC126837966 [Adelges cooleyi]
MKLFCLLIFFFFVDVLADDGDDYYEYFKNTTEAIMFLCETNDLTEGGRSGRENLEHLIEKMVDDTTSNPDYKDFCKICFLIAVPDKIEIISRILAYPIANTRKFQKGFFLLQRMLLDLEKKIGRPYQLHIDTEETFGDISRRYIVPTLINIIGRRVLDGSVQPVEDEASLTSKCYFIGLYLSAQTPKSFIITVQINLTNRTCIFTNKNYVQKIYRTDDVQSLRELLGLENPPVPPTS